MIREDALDIDLEAKQETFIKDRRLADLTKHLSPGKETTLQNKNGRMCLIEEVLVIEDCASTRKLLKKTLESVGFFVHEAESAEEGIYKASLVPNIRLIFLDLSLPKLSGLAAITEIRRIGAAHAGENLKQKGSVDQKVKICVLTGAKEEAVIEQAFQKGADDYIVKPFFKDGLISKAGMLIRNKDLIEAYHVRPVQFAAQLLESDIRPDISVLGIDELSLTLRCSAEIAPEKLLLIECSKMLRAIGLNDREHLRLKVNRCSRKESGQYIVRARFVGISEEEDSIIRAYVIQTKEQAS